jgi:hypothetical protein
MWIVGTFKILLPVTITYEGTSGQIWVAWLVISGLLLGIGVLVKIINSRKSSLTIYHI